MKSNVLRPVLKLLAHKFQCAELVVQPVQLPAEHLLIVPLPLLQPLNLQGPALQHSRALAPGPDEVVRPLLVLGDYSFFLLQILKSILENPEEGNATGKIPDKHFTRLLAEYDEEQTGLETSIAEWQRQIENWNADKLKTDQFIQLVKRYTDFSELTTPMLNEFIEKVIVYEGEGRGNDRRQQEEQAAKEARLKELAKARYEKRKAEKREFTARKKAGLLIPEELEAEEKRLAHNREWQKEWREKRKASEPEKPPKQKSIKELMAVEKTGADLTPEDTERLAAYRRKKADQQRARREGKKSDQPKRKVS